MVNFPGRCLGFILNFDYSKKNLFQHMADRFKARFQSWNEKMLSQVGTLVLIKSVLKSLPMYTMSCFKIPKTICEQIDSTICNQTYSFPYLRFFLKSNFFVWS